MNKITSFTIDHTTLNPGIYISRIDGDITTYDLRFIKPNASANPNYPLLTNSQMHSFEHLFATFARNSQIASDVIYFGPMGCQTGFYFLVKNSDSQKTINIINQILVDIINYDGDMPGDSPKECGNYMNLNINEAKKIATEFYNITKNWKVADLEY
ncbi:MAG: S-ribosylhomocysteine lyase [Clostridiales bacterium]|jgi:S-ribosylhomocysteine lyase|nr:S-ribosylhomocysteine lyase [Clostridiales bacterium]